MNRKFYLKILYVEDDTTLREQFRTFFERRCDELLLASDGEEGLKLVEEHNPDIVITDIKMPVMDGLEMFEKIRIKNKKIPVLVTSAFNDQDYLLKAINLGVTRYILKPFNRTILRQIIDETIDFVNLKKSEKIHKDELTTIFNSSKDGIALVDLNLDFIKLNKTICLNLKIEEDELLNNNFLNFINENQKEEISTLLKRTIFNKSIDNVNSKIISKDTTMPILLTAVLMPNKKSIIITTKDISNMKKNQHIIKTNLKLINDNIINLQFDLDYNITYVSNAFLKISNYDKNEILGQKLHALFSSNIDESTLNDVLEKIINGESWEGELKNIDKYDNEYWLKVKFFAMHNENNKRIAYSVIMQDITDKKALEELSIRDGLTNLYNRRYFQEKLETFLNSAKRRDELIFFLMLDIDFFKQYNDNYGHQEGDYVIVEVAKVLKKFMKRSEDYSFRIGGEEFAVLFYSETFKNAYEFSKKIFKAVEDLKIEHKYSNTSEYVTVSMGLNYGKASKIQNAKTFFKNTDNLLYEAKNCGRNTLVYKK
ncbi:MAG: hypothetical protein CL624_09235 [Arcobacter sp.]|nr:hypothetical protein [Arcobacter sp.]|tara:strand:- start:3167 stop:4786 length:1620 start_codon:yes stop_codon:yes gene_type:complete